MTGTFPSGNNQIQRLQGSFEQHFSYPEKSTCRKTNSHLTKFIDNTIRFMPQNGITSKEVIAVYIPAEDIDEALLYIWDISAALINRERTDIVLKPHAPLPNLGWINAGRPQADYSQVLFRLKAMTASIQPGTSEEIQEGCTVVEYGRKPACKKIILNVSIGPSDSWIHVKPITMYDKKILIADFFESTLSATDLLLPTTQAS